MAQRSITITYEIHPPSANPIPADLDKSKTHTFPVSISSGTETNATTNESYYKQLEKALADARNAVGDELTRWRDLVGKTELSKETKKSLNYGEEGEEEDE